MNVFCIVGTVKELPVLKETVNGTKTCTVLIQVERQFQNNEGVYESDEIQVEVWRGLAETLCSVCKEGDWLSVKGRIVCNKLTRNDRTYFNYAFIAEKIGFMTPN